MAMNAELTREYLDIIEELGGDAESRAAARRYMHGSTAIVHHRVVESSFLPRLFNRRTFEVMAETAQTAHRILCKVMQRYLDDAAYRRVFDFDPRLEELILLPRGYDSLLPFARVDTFLDEDTYEMMFCEFNGDGSSGMNENREITSSVRSSASMRKFAQTHRVQGCDLFEPWVDAFIRIYEGCEHRVETPRFAICDYLENGVVDEFHIFAGLFEERGVPCAVCDVRELRFDGEVLRDGDGRRVDAIWRRCVTNDVIEHWDASQDLISAVRERKVALIGSFAGHIVHDKQIFEVLFKPETRAFLSAEEQAFVERTVPQTLFLDERHVSLDEVKANRERWLIKPTDHYGADDVYAGCEVGQGEWEALVERFANGRAGTPFIVQRYIQPFKTLTLPPDAGLDEDATASSRVERTGQSPVPTGETARTRLSEPALYNNLNGLYLYDGVFQGVFSRLGPNPTISKDNQGITAATIWVDADAPCGIEIA